MAVGWLALQAAGGHSAWCGSTCRVGGGVETVLHAGDALHVSDSRASHTHLPPPAAPQLI